MYDYVIFFLLNIVHIRCELMKRLSLIHIRQFHLNYMRIIWTNYPTKCRKMRVLPNKSCILRSIDKYIKCKREVSKVWFLAYIFYKYFFFKVAITGSYSRFLNYGAFYIFRHPCAYINSFRHMFEVNKKMLNKK